MLCAMNCLRGANAGIQPYPIGPRAAIGRLCKNARAAGASRFYWLTQESNAVARALYDKLAERSGFIQYRKLF